MVSDGTRFSLLHCHLSEPTYFFRGTTAQLGPRAPHCWGFYMTQNCTHTHTHTHTHTTHTQPVALLWTSEQLVAELSTKQTQLTRIHSISGIRTRDHSNQVDSELRLIAWPHESDQNPLYTLLFVKLPVIRDMSAQYECGTSEPHYMDYEVFPATWNVAVWQTGDRDVGVLPEHTAPHPRT